MLRAPLVNPLTSGAGSETGTDLTAANMVASLGSSLKLWLRAEDDTTCLTGGGRQFYAPDKTSLQHADNAFLSTGDIDYVICGMFYVDAVTTEFLMAKGPLNTASSAEHTLWIFNTNLIFDVNNQNGRAYINGVTAGRWHFVVAWHDATNNQVGIQLDNGTPVTTSYSGGSPDGAYSFILGETTGKLSQVSFFKSTAARTIIDSAAERTWLYNLGNGRLTGEIAARYPTEVAGTTWDGWNLNETSGTANAVSYSGANDLTPTFGELLSNTGFETAGGGGADVFANWTEVIDGGTTTINDETVAMHAGAHAARLDIDAVGWTATLHQNVLTTGHRYQYSLYSKNGGSGNGAIGIGYGSFDSIGTTGSYAQYTGTKTALDTFVFILSNVANASIYIDTVSVKAVDIPPCNGPSTDIASDSSGNGNHGVFNGDPTAWSTGISTALNDGGLCLLFDGSDDQVICGSIGAVTAISFYIKSVAANQEIMTLANSTATAITVAAGVLTFGASLTASAITVDGVSKNATEAGALINDGDWHLVAFSLSSISASNLRLGTDSSAFGNIYLDEVKFNAGVLAYYKLDDGAQGAPVDGDPILEITSKEGSRYQFQQATAAKRPTYLGSAINSKAGLVFDGTDDLLRLASAPLTGTAGYLWIAMRLTAVPDAYQIVFASSDEAGTTKLMRFGRGPNANPQFVIGQNDGGTEDLLAGNNTLDADTDYVAEAKSTGTAISARVSSLAQTLSVLGGGSNAGDWFGDVSARDNTTLGALKTTSESLFAAVRICEVMVTDDTITADQLADIRAYFEDQYNVMV